jgi:pyruvate dehydrogenase E2 component (dihydrolipoyllysine-residue acetyltransferase)
MSAETVVAIGMPKLSDSMEEATVLAWLKRPGDRVERGEPLVEVETDKATIVYEAETGGVLDEILVDDGQTAALGATIAHLRTSEVAPQAAPQPARTTAPPEPTAPAPRPRTEDRARATPVARRLAQERGVSLADVAGSGPGGRIVASDVPGASANGAPGRGASTPVDLTPTQRTIGRRMAESRASIPEFTLESEVDMEAAARLREELGSAQIDPLPSFNDLVIRAVALALRRFPALNATYVDAPVRHSRVNLGIAVATDDALIVPTIFDADRKSVLELAKESRALADGARRRSLTAEQLGDGTFTVSNLGMYGIRRFNAVINPPQAAILAVGEVAERAVVRDGAVVPRMTMDVALSCDHRVVYGAEAAQFLQEARRLLEHPSLLLLEGGAA